MNTPLSFCDVSARYGQMPAPRQTAAEKAGWNTNQLFQDYLSKVRKAREEAEEHADEDALMAMIDAMNAPEEERTSNQDMVAAQSLAKAGPAAYNSERFEKIRETFDGKVNLSVMPEIRALLCCLGDPGTFKQVDDIQEEQQEQREQLQKEERLEVTETRTPGETGDPEPIEKEV